MVYGSQWLENQEYWPGQTIGELLSDSDLKTKAGYGNLKEGNIIYAIDGVPVNPTDKISDHEKKETEGQLTIEVLRNVGEKALILPQS